MMKHFFFILILLSSIGCNTASDKAGNRFSGKTPKAEFVFKEEFHNFGALQAGEIVAFSFSFKNTGDGDLIIKNVETDCGCITVKYPKEAIKKGETAYIEVIFNSAGEAGKVYKEIHVATNADKEEFILAIAALIENDFIDIYGLK